MVNFFLKFSDKTWDEGERERGKREKEERGGNDGKFGSSTKHANPKVEGNYPLNIA